MATVERGAGTLTREEELALIDAWVAARGVHRITPAEVEGYAPHRSKFYEQMSTSRKRRGAKKNARG